MNEDIEYGTILNSSNFEKMEISDIDNTYNNYFYKFNCVNCFCYNFDIIRIHCKSLCTYMYNLQNQCVDSLGCQCASSQNLHYVIKLYIIVLIFIFIFLMDRILNLNIF